MTAEQGMRGALDSALYAILDIITKDTRISDKVSVILGTYAYNADFPQIWVVDEEITDESDTNDIIEEDGLICQFYVGDAHHNLDSAYKKSRSLAGTLVDVLESGGKDYKDQRFAVFSKIDFLDITPIDPPENSSLHISFFCVRMKFYFQRQRFYKYI